MIRWLFVSVLIGATAGLLLTYSRGGALTIGATAALVLAVFAVRAVQQDQETP